MEFDLDTCLKSFRDSYHQFKIHQSEEHAKDLERQLNVLVGVTNHGNEKILNHFNPQNLLHSGSLSIFVNILNEENLRESIYGSAMSLLNGLAASSKIRKTLQDIFKLTSTLLSFIMQHQNQNDQSILLQCLHLLQQITYGIKIDNALGELSTLIKYLVSKIVSPESKMTMPCLGSLANLCRNNPIVQDYIKNMSNVKTFFKSVASFLSHDNWMNIIYALSLLSISLDEPLGEKVFNKKNIDQTFLLIFNVLLKGGSFNTRKYSCDLLIDLLKCDRMQQYLASYTDLQTHVKELVFNLKATDEDSCEKILELLLCLDCVPNLLKTIFFKVNDKKRRSEDGDDGSCLAIIYNLAGKQMASNLHVASLALKLIKILYKSNPSSAQSVPKLVPILSKNLHFIEEYSPGNLKEKFGNIRRNIEILQILCCGDKAVEMVSGHLNIQSIHGFITKISNKYSLEFTSEHQSNADYRLEISSVFIGLIELLLMIVNQSGKGQDLCNSVLQSQDSSPFLACCLASQSINLVQRSMKIIIQQASQMSNFSADTLSVIIAKNNKQREDEINALKKQNLADASYHVNTNLMMQSETPKSKQNGKRCNDKDDSITMLALADRISSSLEIKDSAKISEIMDIYEHKLAAIHVKERQLQDLLDAKTTALSQSDRFIAQYRCRSAQSEAECLKLRSILLESQKTSEEQQEKIKGLIAELNTLVEKVECMSDENKTLAERSAEFERLKVICQDQIDKLGNLQTSLAASEEDNRNLNEMNEMLKNHCDNLKCQYECSQQQLRETEQEKQNLMKRLKEKEKKIEETTKRISKLEDQMKEQSNNLHEVEKQLTLTETELKFAEQAKLELNQKIEALEKEKRDLLEIVEEFEQLQITHQDFKQRLETTQRSLDVAEKENNSLNELNTMLRKQGDNLKSKQEGLLQHLKELEKEKHIMQQNLNDKEKKHEELLKSISTLKQEVKGKENEIKEFEKKTKGLEKQLKQTEKAKVDLSHKVSSLSVLNDKYEKEMKENDVTIQDLKTQLEKHSQIAAMIHNLSSGKIPCNALNFSS